MKHSDRDIKLARAKNDLDVLQTMTLPVSVFIEAIKGNSPRKLCVVYEQTCHLINNKKNTFSTIIDYSKLSKAFLNSKFTVNAVAKFQVVYQNARNKEIFLKNMQEIRVETHQFMIK